MKINRVKLSCRTDVPVIGESDLDHTLILFRSPVIIPTNGKSRNTGVAAPFCTTAVRRVHSVPQATIRYTMT